jgi:hypothetical protein
MVPASETPAQSIPRLCDWCDEPATTCFPSPSQPGHNENACETHRAEYGPASADYQVIYTAYLERHYGTIGEYTWSITETTNPSACPNHPYYWMVTHGPLISSPLVANGYGKSYANARAQAETAILRMSAAQ